MEGAIDQYVFSAKAKRTSFILMAVGILALVLGITDEHVTGQRIWSNVLINGFFFFSISLAATFFIAMQYAAEAAWATVLKRVFEAVAAYLPLGALFLILVWIAGSMHGHHLYHWMDPHVYDPESEHYDALIAGKSAYLNPTFFWIRALVFIGVYVWYNRVMRKRSILEDTMGGTTLHFGNQRRSAGFLVFFGFTSTVAAWDWIMSIDTHWFSTLFGWYVFSGMWIAAITAATLLTLYLKSKGHLPQVNENHLHDLGKWMFAISFLWTYLWFSQFMLIWYANIPEEATYFIARIEDYKGIYFTMILTNFALPMLLLMDKSNKRNGAWLVVVGIVVFFFHWMDVYMLVTPGTMKDQGTIGILEIGMFLGFLGLFAFVVQQALTKAPLVVKQHPYLEESIHLEIN